MALEFLLRAIAYSIFVAPVVVLIIGAVLYHYKPIHRLTTGIILVSFGSLGILIYSVVFYLVLVNDSSLTGISTIFLTIFTEALTLLVGIKSLINRNVSSNL